MNEMELKITCLEKFPIANVPSHFKHCHSREFKLQNLHGSVLRSKLRELNTNLHSGMIKRVKNPCISPEVPELCPHKMAFYSNKILRDNYLTQTQI